MMQMAKVMTATTFMAIGTMATAHDVAPVGFNSALQSLDGARGYLVSLEGQSLGSRSNVGLTISQGKVRLISGTFETQISFIDGTPRQTPVRDQGGECVVGPSASFGPTIDLILQADTIMTIGTDRVLFTKDGVTLAGFAMT